MRIDPITGEVVEGEWPGLAPWLTGLSDEELDKLSPTLKEQVLKARNHITDADRWRHVLARVEHMDDYYERIKAWTVDPLDTEGYGTAIQRADFKVLVDKGILDARARSRRLKS